MNISFMTTPAGATARRGTLPLVSFNTGPEAVTAQQPATAQKTAIQADAISGKPNASQQLLLACLSGAAAVGPEAVQKSIDALEKNAKTFFSGTEIDRATIGKTLAELSSVLHGNSPAATADHFDHYMGKRLGISPVMVASVIAHIEAGDDADSTRKLAAIINYAVPLVGADLARRIVLLGYNRDRVNLFSQPQVVDRPVAEQVRRNTEQIRELLQINRD